MMNQFIDQNLMKMGQLSAGPSEKCEYAKRFGNTTIYGYTNHLVVIGKEKRKELVADRITEVRNYGKTRTQNKLLGLIITGIIFILSIDGFFLGLILIGVGIYGYRGTNIIVYYNESEYFEFRCSDSEFNLFMQYINMKKNGIPMQGYSQVNQGMRMPINNLNYQRSQGYQPSQGRLNPVPNIAPSKQLTNRGDKFCHNCGTQNSTLTKFCHSCGVNI